MQLFCCPARRRCSRRSSALPARGRCSRGSAPSSAPGGASRTEPPLRMSAMPSRFSFASSSTYRKGSPRYRRAFSVTYMRLERRLAVPFRMTGTRTMLAGECPLFSAWGRFEDGSPATHRRYAANIQLLCGSVEIAVHAVLRRYTSPATHARCAVEVQRRYRPSWRR